MGKPPWKVWFAKVTGQTGRKLNVQYLGAVDESAVDECYEKLNCPSKIDVGSILGKVIPGECHKKECKMHVGKEQFQKFFNALE